VLASMGQVPRLPLEYPFPFELASGTMGYFDSPSGYLDSPSAAIEHASAQHLPASPDGP
jgi:hypothetical protein